MPDKFYFFTDIDKVKPDTSKVFGVPMNGNTIDVNASTCRYTSFLQTKDGESARYYAVCAGLCLFQENENGGYNLILKPVDPLPLNNFGEVKYFIYKDVGITYIEKVGGEITKDSSLINVPPSYGAIYDNTYESHQKRIEINPDTPYPTAKVLGCKVFDKSGTYTENIDDLFNHPDTQPVLVAAGDRIGWVGDSGEVGFEIMMNSPGFNPSIHLAMKYDHVFNEPIPSNPNKAQLMDLYAKRQEVLNYIDPAAFFINLSSLYLLFYKQGEKDELVKEEDLANNLSNGYRIYLDLREENHFGFNFYNEFDGTGSIWAEFQVKSISSGAHSTKVYSQEFSAEWPIIQIENFAFLDPQAYEYTVAGLAAHVKLNKKTYIENSVTKPHEYDLVFFAHNSNQSKGEKIEGKDSFIQLENTPEKDSSDIVLSEGEIGFISTFSNYDSYRIRPFGSYTKIGISKKAGYEGPGLLNKKSALDNIFLPFEMEYTGKPNPTGTEVQIYNTNSFIQFGNYVSPNPYNEDLACWKGVAQDQKNVTFFAYPLNVGHKSSDYSLGLYNNPGQYIINEVDFLFSLSEDRNGFEYKNRIVKYKDGATDKEAKVVMLEQQDGILKTFDNWDPSYMPMVSISKIQLETLKTIKTQNFVKPDLHRVYLTFGKSRDYEVKSGTLHKRELHLKGLKYKTNANNEYHFVEIPTGIFVHAFDTKRCVKDVKTINSSFAIFSSEEAANNTKLKIEALSTKVSGPLQSKLFKDSTKLQSLNNGLLGNISKGMVSDTIEVLQRALRIVVPELDTVSSSAKDEASTLFIDGNFDSSVDRSIRAFQNAMINLVEDGIVGPKTIKQLDLELQKIKYYSYKEDKIYTIHNDHKSVKINQFTVVSKGMGASINSAHNAWVYSEPSKTSNLVRFLHPQEEIQIISSAESRESGPGWLFVQIDYEKGADGKILDSEKANKKEGIFGYIPLTDVWDVWHEKDPNDNKKPYRMPMPVPGSKLYYISENENLWDLVNSKYNVESFNPHGDDEFPFIVNLLMYANNPNNSNHRSIKLGKRGTVDIELYNDDELEAIDATNSYSEWLSKITDSKKKWTKSDWNTSASATINPVIIHKNGHIWLPPAEFVVNLFKTRQRESSYFIQKYNDVVNLVKNYWPEGIGVEVNAGIGATFGIPVAVDLAYSAYIYREKIKGDGIVIKFMKSGEISAGLDAGVGAGFYVGSGKKVKGGKSPNDKYGIGAEASASVESKVKVSARTEYEFPLYPMDANNTDKKDLGLFALLGTVLNAESTPAFTAARFFATLNGYNIDPESYLTKLKVSVGREQGVYGSASAGIRVGSEDYKTKWVNSGSTPSQRKLKHKDVPKTSAKNLLLSKMEVSLDAQASSSQALAFEIALKYDKDRYNVEAGKRMISESTIEVSLEGSATVSGLIDRGIGLKARMEYKNAVNDFEFRDLDFSNLIFEPYTFSGDFDNYNGPANELSLVLKNIIPSSNSSSVEELIGQNSAAIVQELNYKRRLSFESLFELQFKNKKGEQKILKSLFPGNIVDRFSLGFSAYLDIEVSMDLAKIKADGKLEVFKDHLIKLYNEVKNIITDLTWGKFAYELPKIIMNQIRVSSEEIKKAVIDILGYFTFKRVGIHVNFVEIGAAFGANVGAELKARLEFHLEGKIFFHEDYILDGEIYSTNTELPKGHDFNKNDFSYDIVKFIEKELLDNSNAEKLSEWVTNFLSSPENALNSVHKMYNEFFLEDE